MIGRFIRGLFLFSVGFFLAFTMRVCPGCAGASHTVGAAVKGPGGVAVELYWTIDPNKVPDPPPDPWTIEGDKP